MARLIRMADGRLLRLREWCAEDGRTYSAGQKYWLRRRRQEALTDGKAVPMPRAKRSWPVVEDDGSEVWLTMAQMLARWPGLTADLLYGRLFRGMAHAASLGLPARVYGRTPEQMQRAAEDRREIARAKRRAKQSADRALIGSTLNVDMRRTSDVSMDSEYPDNSTIADCAQAEYSAQVEALMAEDPDYDVGSPADDALYDEIKARLIAGYYAECERQLAASPERL